MSAPFKIFACKGITIKLTFTAKTPFSFLIPVNAPFLSEFIGVPLAATSEEFDAYYQNVNERINTAAPDEFTPSLNAIDELISSIVIVEK